MTRVGWPKSRIGSLCEITSSKRIFAADYVSEGVPFYRAKEIREKQQGSCVSTPLFISREKFEAIRAKFGAPVFGDMLLTSIGALLGTPYVINEHETFYFKDGNLTWFRNFRGFDSRFLYYWLLSPEGRGELRKSTIGSAQPAFTIALLKEMQIKLPPLSVQRRVVQILSTYDALITNHTRRIKILEQMAQMLYREWFVNFRFPGHEKVRMVDSELGQIPRDWEVASFTDVANVLSGGTPRTTEPQFWDGEIPFFGPVDAPNGFYILRTKKTITTLGLSRCNSKLYPADTVFITARGTVGKVALPSVPMAMNQSCYALCAKPGVKSLFLFMLTRECTEQLQQKATGAVFDAITVDTFNRLEIVRPPNVLTEKFESVARPLFLLILNLSKKNENLRYTRNLLLPKLVSGEISVEQIETETAAQTV